MSTTGVDTAREAFRRTFDRDPAGVWSAPGRVNLIGEHTDYNDGFVLPFAIDRRTWVAIAPRTDRRVRISSDAGAATAGSAVVEVALDDLRPGAVEGWAAYPLGVAWAIGDLDAHESAELCGFDAYVTSDVPLGAGLSSSAALECATAVALSELWSLELWPDELLRVTHRAENEMVGAPTGILDQSASLFSAVGSALFIDCRDRAMEQIPFPLEEHDLTVLVVDTGVAHAHADGGYAARRASCERAAKLLGVAALRDVTPEQLDDARDLLDEETYRRARHIVTENERVLRTVATVRAAGPAAIGDLLVASHASMRDDFEISVHELDLVVESALAAGAIGARMTGGGFGGSAIALVARDRLDEVTDAVMAAFAEAGLAAPRAFAVEPSRGAGRDV